MKWYSESKRKVLRVARMEEYGDPCESRRPACAFSKAVLGCGVKHGQNGGWGSRGIF